MSDAPRAPCAHCGKPTGRRLLPGESRPHFCGAPACRLAYARWLYAHSEARRRSIAAIKRAARARRTGRGIVQEATPADATGLRPQELTILELLALRGPLRRATIVGTSPRRSEALNALVAAGRVVYEPVPRRSKPGLARTGGRYRLTEHERQALDSAAHA